MQDPTKRELRARAASVVALARDNYRDVPPTYLRLTASGAPEHPLYVPGSVQPTNPFPGAVR